MKTWRRNIKPARKYPTIFEGRNTHVARVVANSGEDDATIEARCNLIAAAPELLELAKSIAVQHMWFSQNPQLQALINGWITAAQAVVAKAEGRE